MPGSRLVQKVLHELSKPRTGEKSGRFSGVAIVDELIRPGFQGRVYFRSSWWPARSEQLLLLYKGRSVEVVGIEGITLLVRPISNKNRR